MGRTFHPDKRRTFTSLIYTRLKVLRAISVPRKTRISGELPRKFINRRRGREGREAKVALNEPLWIIGNERERDGHCASLRVIISFSRWGRVLPFKVFSIANIGPSAIKVVTTALEAQTRKFSKAGRSTRDLLANYLPAFTKLNKRYPVLFAFASNLPRL